MPAWCRPSVSVSRSPCIQAGAIDDDANGKSFASGGSSSSGSSSRANSTTRSPVRSRSSGSRRPPHGGSSTPGRSRRPRPSSASRSRAGPRSPTSDGCSSHSARARRSRVRSSRWSRGWPISMGSSPARGRLEWPSRSPARGSAQRRLRRPATFPERSTRPPIGSSRRRSPTRSGTARPVKRASRSVATRASSSSASGTGFGPARGDRSPASAFAGCRNGHLFSTADSPPGPTSDGDWLVETSLPIAPEGNA